jgi:hypothetical protein
MELEQKIESFTKNLIDLEEKVTLLEGEQSILDSTVKDSFNKIQH